MSDLTIDLIESLKTTLLGMGTVLITLYLLSLILDFMRYIFYRPQQVKKNKITEQDTITTPEHIQEDDTELIAVITAAIATHIKKPAYMIKINSICQIHKTTPAWGMAARYAQKRILSRT